MEKKRKTNTKNLWMYAVLLFTSAFIVLVLTAYSQIKFNSRIDDYKTDIENEVSEKNDVKVNLNQALEENKAILDELEKLKEANAKMKSENDNLKLENKNLSTINNQIANMYEKYLNASYYYSINDYMNSAKELFVDFDVTMLKGSAYTNAEEMMTALRPGLAEKAYLEGYKHYSLGNYSIAIGMFKLSLAVSKDFYFSDDCYYLTAYSYHFLGDNTSARAGLKELIEKYPSSDLSTDAKNLNDSWK